jgi:polyisoprenoid-binding protein YceI
MKKVLLSAFAIVTLGAVIVAFKPADNQLTPAHDNLSTDLPAQGQTTWVVDKGHSNVKFSVTHMVVSEMEGSFRTFDGSVVHSKADLSDAKIEFTVDINSVFTDNDRRDAHLKSNDFFNAEQYPQMKFVSTSFVPQGGKKYKLSGNLTIRDVTKPVVFDVTFGGTIPTQNGGAKAGFTAVGSIDRFDYNLKWDRATESGNLVVSREVAITIKLEMNKKTS